jgi:hypothetical protein
LRFNSFIALVYREKAGLKLCFVSVFFVSFKIVNHGGHQGNTACALAQWRHLVALHEAKDVLHWAMHIVLYPPSGMVIKIVADLATFSVIINSMFAHNHS